tara:strand:+ start:108 stop:281 length:174 start_codon:yes stop_codon:yes gene_type:complete
MQTNNNATIDHRPTISETIVVLRREESEQESFMTELLAESDRYTVGEREEYLNAPSI